jgi:exodeoxyribonuclease V gamma subunit
MGVDLYFSNQLIPLVEKLHDNLRPDGSGCDGLEPAVVIVPNMNLSKWIKLTLARKSGIFMNVDFQYLEAGLWNMIRTLDLHRSPEPERLDNNNLRILLFFILMKPDLDAPDLAPVSSYLQLADGQVRSDFEIRCWQLSQELARLFQEYEYHRSDMIQRWLAGDPAADAMEGCQRWIYRKMVSLKNQVSRVADRPIRSMTEYARDVLSADASPRQRGGDTRVQFHFFGLSQISPFHLQLLSRLEPYYDIQIYSLNPSREYWEDIKTPFEKKWIERKKVSGLKPSDAEWSAGDLFAEADHALLSAWGKPGRENIRLLCQLTDFNFHAGYSPIPRPETVLEAIGYGLLTLDGRETGSPPLTQDRSLQITACPGIRREVETVYSSILFNLEADPELCLTDIAVMVSDMARYKPVVDSVFSRRPIRFTYNLVDSSARMESVFAQAVLALMALCRGNFSRKQVFDLLRNPCVMQRWDFGPETLSVWVGWSDALGVFHDYENQEARAEDIPPGGFFSWRQGVERLRISRIMTIPDDIDAESRPHFSGLVPFADINTGDDRLLEKFCRIVEGLVGAVKSLTMASASALAWKDAFFRVVDQFIEISADMRGEETVYQSLIRAFDEFLRYDELAQVQPGRPLTADALWAFVRSHLDGISGGQGDYLTGGVTISALMPMRPIPFKLVYVLGLEEGRFPGREPESLLDLRSRKRRIGDITMADRNRYLFLEIMISVGSKLYLSYVSRDLQKDRDLSPCSVVHQLRRYVEQQVLGGQAFKIGRVPIKADSPAYTAPSAMGGWSDVMVESSPAQRLSCYRRSGLWDAFVNQATPEELETAIRYQPDFSFPADSSASESTDAVPLTIDLLRRFLIDPIGVVGRYHLGIGEQVDPTAELAELEDEPLSSRFPVDYELRTTPVRQWLSTMLTHSDISPALARLEARFESVYADLSRKSRVPAGAFAVQDRDRLKQQVLAAGAILYPVVEQMRSARQLFPAVVVGSVMDESLETDGRHLRVDPVTIQRGGTRMHPQFVQLSGGTPWVWQAPDGSWHCLVLTGSNRRSRFADKYVLGPLLTLMAASAGDAPAPWLDAGRIRMHVVYRTQVLNLDYSLDPDRSSAYLAGLASEFLSPLPPVWLPFEIVFANGDLRSLIDQDAVSDQERSFFNDALAEAMQAETDVQAELTGATLTPDSLDRARRRFRVFLP